MIEQAVQAFILEAEELLNDLENMILGLEDDTSKARVDEIFRALHTVKGSGAMFAHTALSRFTHHFENAFELVRAGQLEVSAELIDLSLKSRDIMVEFLDLGGDGPDAEDLIKSDKATRLIALLSNLTGVRQSGQNREPVLEHEAATTQAEECFEIIFTPDSNALKNGMRPDLLMKELAELGECSVKYAMHDLPELSDLEPGLSYTEWRISLTTKSGQGAIDEVFIFADDADLKITRQQQVVPESPDISVTGKAE